MLSEFGREKEEGLLRENRRENPSVIALSLSTDLRTDLQKSCQLPCRSPADPRTGESVLFGPSTIETLSQLEVSSPCDRLFTPQWTPYELDKRLVHSSECVERRKRDPFERHDLIKHWFSSISTMDERKSRRRSQSMIRPRTTSDRRLSLHVR